MAAMSIFKKMFSETPGAPRSVKQILVDGGSLTSGDGSPAPRDQLDLLRKAGRFAEQEKLPVTVVFQSEPLRKVGDGEQFEGATVRYVEDADAFTREFVRIAEGLNDCAVVTRGGDLEKECRGKGLTALRDGTFRKALEGGGSRSSGRRRSGGSSRGGSRRSQSRQGDSNEGSNKNRSRSSSNRGKGGSRPPREKEEPKGVEDLIDVVE